MEVEPKLTVAVDSDLCSGCGNCVQYAPDVFVHVDGVSFVKRGEETAESMEDVVVPGGSEHAVMVAAQECPGEIIYVHTL